MPRRIGGGLGSKTRVRYLNLTLEVPKGVRDHDLTPLIYKALKDYFNGANKDMEFWSIKVKDVTVVGKLE